MKIFLGFLIAGLARGGAVWLHGYKPISVRVNGMTDLSNRPIYLHHRYGWQDPIAVVLAFAGVGAGLALVVSDVRPQRVVTSNA